MLSGCYSTYSGVYNYERDDHLPMIETDEMETAIYDTLIPLGFRRQKLDWYNRDFYLLQLNPELTLPEYDDLDGSNAHMSITLDPDRTITIRIRDFDHNKETEFMKVVKQKIEDMLRTRFNMQEPKFRRAPDFMGP